MLPIFIMGEERERQRERERMRDRERERGEKETERESTLQDHVIHNKMRIALCVEIQ